MEKTGICEICKETFVRHQKRQRYCSSTCRSVAFNKKNVIEKETLVEENKTLLKEKQTLHKTLSVTKKKSKKLIDTIKKEVPGSYSPEKVKEIEAEAEILLQELLKLKF